jgi:hypothetical protein
VIAFWHLVEAMAAESPSFQVGAAAREVGRTVAKARGVEAAVELVLNLGRTFGLVSETG